MRSSFLTKIEWLVGACCVALSPGCADDSSSDDSSNAETSLDAGSDDETTADDETSDDQTTADDETADDGNVDAGFGTLDSGTALPDQTTSSDAGTLPELDSGSMDGGMSSEDLGLDPQVPPTDPELMSAWLEQGHYLNWACEDAANAKTDGAPAIHVHGATTRVCSNILLAASVAPDAEHELPANVAAVKEVYDADSMLTQRVVSVKTSASSDAGDGWYWYASPELEGFGIAECAGCHSAAASDADHPGLGDFVYFQVRDEANLPPIGNTEQLQAWLSDKSYANWACEENPSDKTFGAAAIHVHGRNRICTNARLAEAELSEGQWPAGAAAVKELYAPGDAGDLLGAVLYLKVAADSNEGQGWYWYEDGVADGFGQAACTGCHSVAGSDDEHAGAGDFVYWQQTP